MADYIKERTITVEMQAEFDALQQQFDIPAGTGYTEKAFHVTLDGPALRGMLYWFDNGEVRSCGFGLSEEITAPAEQAAIRQELVANVKRHPCKDKPVALVILPCNRRPIVDSFTAAEWEFIESHYAALPERGAAQ